MASFDIVRSNKNGDMPHCPADGDSSDGGTEWPFVDSGTGGRAKLGGAPVGMADAEGVTEVCSAATIGVSDEEVE